ncbi:MAG: exo-alpha-sialidase [Planctomycetes bacterium]|nr:exo-alpha-sialidase [Planctomycetota bacterium]
MPPIPATRRLSPRRAARIGCKEIEMKTAVPTRTDFRLTPLAATLMALLPSLAAGEGCPAGEKAAPPDAPPSSAAVWTSGREGYHTYRIPSIIATPAGTLLAFCEGRKKSRSDTGDIDLLLKRSLDGGRTWSDSLVVWDDGPNTCGNPCPAVEAETRTIWLLLTHNLGVDREPEIIAKTSRSTRTVWVTRSEDDGETWAPPREITAEAKRPDWTWYATGPGVGIQLERGPHRGRLVIPCDHIEAETRRYFSHVICSDDRGKTWTIGGRSPADKVNECQVVELQGGRLMLNMRNYDRSQKNRAVCVSDDGGITWKDFRHDPALIEPICQASLIRHPAAGDAETSLLLFSNPASRDARVDMTVRASEDEGETWPRARLLHRGPAAYSCLVALPGHTAGCLFEGGEKSPYEAILFCRFPLDSLAAGDASTH